MIWGWNGSIKLRKVLRLKHEVQPSPKYLHHFKQKIEEAYKCANINAPPFLIQITNRKFILALTRKTELRSLSKKLVHAIPTVKDKKFATNHMYYLLLSNLYM